MKALVSIAAIISMFLSIEAYAKNASEVFEIASQSTVIVFARDEKGNDAGFGSGVILESAALDPVVAEWLQDMEFILCGYAQNPNDSFKRYSEVAEQVPCGGVHGTQMPIFSAIGTTFGSLS